MKAISRALEKLTEPRLGTWARVLQAAQQEALAAGHTRIGSEHLVLALVVDGAGSAAQRLREHGIDADALRQRIIDDVNARGGDPQAPSTADLRKAGVESPVDQPLQDTRSSNDQPRPASLHRLSRAYRWTPEALAVLDTATEHANDRNQGTSPRHRNLTDDDLAVALATTRGTRAADLLKELDLPLDAIVAAADEN